MPLPTWTASDTTGARFLGIIEIETGKDLEPFEVLALPDRLVFGNSANACFLESGFIIRDDFESEDDTLRELVDDLETFYRDGKGSTSRIVHNERL